MADWAGLHCDILVSILQKIKLVEDFVAFGAVCKSWSQAASNNKRYLRPQIPWLILPDNVQTKANRQIYSLCKEDILTKNLHVPEVYDKKCIGLNYGWVLAVSRKGEMNLVHLLSRSQIQLPNQKSIDYYKESKAYPCYATTSCAALSANPSESSDFVVMIAHGGAGWYLSYWRLGDKRWTGITNQAEKILYSDLNYYEGRFYAIDYGGTVWAYTVSNPRDRTLVTDLNSCIDRYIVESKGDLLIVSRDHEFEQLYDEMFENDEDIVENSEGEEEVQEVYKLVGYRTCGFKVFKLDLINGGHKQIKSLDDRAIFVGHNTAVSVDVSDFRGGLIKSDHIYFTDDNVEGYVWVKKGGGEDMGSYNLEDDRITHFKIDEAFTRSRISPPFWFIPSF